MTDNNGRITTLTTDAIRATGEKMIADIQKQVDVVENMAEGIRVLAKQFEEEIGKRTLQLTDHISAYQALGAKTTDMFRTMYEAMQPNGKDQHNGQERHDHGTGTGVAPQPQERSRAAVILDDLQRADGDRFGARRDRPAPPPVRD